jgi:arginase
MKISLLGAPFNSDGTTPEEENPAQGLRDVGLITLLKSSGHSVTDFGDIEIPKPRGCRDRETGILNLSALQEVSRRLASRLNETLKPDEFAIVLGGDCTILIGILGAFAARDIDAGLVFFDGHADFQSKETSSTGEAADFELAFLTGRGPREITELFDKCPLVSDQNIVAFGLREPDLIGQSEIQVYTKEQMAQAGVTQSVRDGLSRLVASKLPLWLHFDVDVIDPALVPVLIPASNGLTFEQAREFLVQALGSVHFLGMSVACYHPNLDTFGQAGRQIATMICDAIQRFSDFGTIPGHGDCSFEASTFFT